MRTHVTRRIPHRPVSAARAGRSSMPYTVRRWLSSDGYMMDDSKTANTPEEAIAAAVKLAGTFDSLVSEEIKQKIRSMGPGDAIKIKRQSLRITMRIKRQKE